jgi:hypothetical protein
MARCQLLGAPRRVGFLRLCETVRVPEIAFTSVSPVVPVCNLDAALDDSPLTR